VGQNSSIPSLTCAPIGVVRSPMLSKFDAPHQPDRTGAARATIELFPHQDFDKALEDLSGFDYVWVLFWFHRNKTWKPKVLPPRGGEKKRGVFATRSPHRPNPIGISALELIKIDGRQITVGSCDLIDGTPILDIKPYIPATDSFPEAHIGWVQSVEESFLEPPRYQITYSPLALQQIEWLRERGVNFIDRASSILSRDPSAHRTRRISRYGEELFRMGCAEWRVFFKVKDEVVSIEYIKPGFALSRLQSEGSEVIKNRDYQIEFLSVYQGPVRC
jgi:tRNA (adenine37-N6)-methyltransferase